MNISNENDNKQQIIEATYEIDEPRNTINPQIFTIDSKLFDKNEAANLEKEKLRHEFLRDWWAVLILSGSILLMFIIYLSETYWSKDSNIPPSELAKTIIEALKFLMSALIGFLFVKRLDK